MSEPETALASEAVESVEESPHALSHQVQGMSCPSCGGALEVDSGMRVVTCPFCETPLLAVSEVGIRRLAVAPQIGAERARGIVRDWLDRGVHKDPALRKQATLAEAFLCFLPFYRVESDVVGVALGTEERTRWTGTGKNRRAETYEVDVERPVERSFDRTFPALNVFEWGIRRVHLQGDPLVPYDARELERLGMVFPPAGDERAVRDAALERFRREADPSGGLKRVRYRFLQSLRERLSVVYYPLWVVRYRHRDRSYQVLVDAEDATLAYGKAPGNDLYRALALVATQAVGLYVATTALQLFGGDLGGFIFVGAGLLAFLAWGWKKFRYGGVVVEGTGLEAESTSSLASRLGSRRGRDHLLRELVSGSGWKEKR